MAEMKNPNTAVELEESALDQVNGGLTKVGPGTLQFTSDDDPDHYTEIVSPRDTASGLPTGKRTHKP